MAMRSEVTRLIHIERTVASLAAATAFYRDALGFEMVDASLVDPAWDALYPDHRVEAASLKLGDQTLKLTMFDPPGAGYPALRSSSDICFQHFAMTTKNIDAAHDRLKTHSHTAITLGEPVRLPHSSGDVRAYKFRDAEGHPLEFLQFPDEASKDIGIDHTAISVSDTTASINFYCNLLGMKLASRQINQGPEQAQLDAIAHAEADIVALNPVDTSTPHLELLGYNVSRPADHEPWMPWDIAGDRTVFAVKGLEKLLARLSLGEHILRHVPSRNTALIRDVDGHLLVLKESP